MPSRERRVSRFKVSVVTEPDRSKLTPPSISESKFPEPSRKESDSSSSSGDPIQSSSSNAGVANLNQMPAGTPPTAAQMVQTQLPGSAAGWHGVKGMPQGAGSGAQGQDFTTVINTTFDSLKTTLVKSLPNTGGKEMSNII